MKQALVDYFVLQLFLAQHLSFFCSSRLLPTSRLVACPTQVRTCRRASHLAIISAVRVRIPFGFRIPSRVQFWFGCFLRVYVGLLSSFSRERSSAEQAVEVASSALFARGLGLCWCIDLSKFSVGTD